MALVDSRGHGVGIAGYVSLPVEPALWIGAVAKVVALVMAVLARHHQVWLVAVITALVLTGGFAAAQLRTAWVAAPILEKEIRPVYVSGRVVASEIRVSGCRLVLDDVRITGLAPDATPATVRVILTRMAEFGSNMSLMRAASGPGPRAEAGIAIDYVS